MTLRACLLSDVAHRIHRQLLPEIDTDSHTQRPFNIQYLCHQDPRFRARDIHSTVCVRAKDRYLRIRPITYVCRRFVAKSRPCCRRDLLFIRLGGSLFEYSATYVKRRTWLVGRCYGIAAARYTCNRENRVINCEAQSGCLSRKILSLLQ